MLSLYFNCKLTGKKLTADRLDSGYYYPVTYPKKMGVEEFNQYKVMLKTIESYAVFKFDIVIFNLDIDLLDEDLKKEV
jgi:hypothetical protein